MKYIKTYELLDVNNFQLLCDTLKNLIIEFIDIDVKYVIRESVNTHKYAIDVIEDYRTTYISLEYIDKDKEKHIFNSVKIIIELYKKSENLNIISEYLGKVFGYYARINKKDFIYTKEHLLVIDNCFIPEVIEDIKKKKGKLELELVAKKYNL
jgi:hypothetical protein